MKRGKRFHAFLPLGFLETTRLFSGWRKHSKGKCNITKGGVHLPPGINKFTLNSNPYSPFRIKLHFLLLLLLLLILPHFYFTHLLFGSFLQFQDNFALCRNNDSKYHERSSLNCPSGMDFLLRKKTKQNKTADGSPRRRCVFHSPLFFVERGRIISGRLTNRFGIRFLTNTELLRGVMGLYPRRIINILISWLTNFSIILARNFSINL